MSTDNNTEKTINDSGAVTVSMKKLVGGMNTVFAGVIEILGAMEAPKAKDLLSGTVPDKKVAEMAAEALDALAGTGKAQRGAENHETENAADGSGMDPDPGSSSDTADSADGASVKEESSKEGDSATTGDSAKMEELVKAAGPSVTADIEPATEKAMSALEAELARTISL